MPAVPAVPDDTRTVKPAQVELDWHQASAAVMVMFALRISDPAGKAPGEATKPEESPPSPDKSSLTGETQIFGLAVDFVHFRSVRWTPPESTASSP